MDQIRVFVSSTSVDLRDERKAVEEAIRRMELPFVGMEYFGSDVLTPVEVCIQKLQQSSIYVGIIGFRYGSLVPGTDKSFTEQEYDSASETGLPRLIYLKSKEAMVRFNDVDSDAHNRERMERFRDLLKSVHAVSYFSSAYELASMVVADLHRLLSRRPERTKLVEETDLLQMPRVIIKRAEIALLSAITYCFQAYHAESSGALTRKEAQQKAIGRLKNYHFRFDGQFTIFNSKRVTVFHDYRHMIGRPFHFTDVDFDPVFRAFSEKSGGVVKWIDQLSSDYLLIDDTFFSRVGGEEHVRFNIAPFSYFEPWDWYILVEAHNEIHGLDKSAVNEIFESFTDKGWLVVSRSR